MSNDDRMFDFMTKMYAEIKEGFKRVDERFDAIENEVKEIKKTVIKIESEHGEKLEALFDGYVHNSEKLDHIEAEVIKHDEFILKRIK